MHAMESGACLANSCLVAVPGLILLHAQLLCLVCMSVYLHYGCTSAVHKPPKYLRPPIDLSASFTVECLHD